MKRTLILFMLVNVLTISQGVEVVKGKVMNRTSNAPIVGVDVKSSVDKVRSNSLGEFSILVESLHEKLYFSKLGYANLEYKLNGNTAVGKVFMEEVLVLEDDAEKAESAMIFEMVDCGMSSGNVKGGSFRVHSVGSANFCPGNRFEQQENYSERIENGFSQTQSSPLSTFSVDVDNAGYSNVRRFLNNGSLPPPDAVKVEEMVNYFHYKYATPLKENPFAIKQELGKCPWNTKHQLLRIGLQTKNIDKEELPFSNLVFLVDVSGSMQAQNKLPLLKSSLKLLVQELRPEDVVSVVTYAGSARVVLQPTSGSDKIKILNAIDQLSAGGSTAGNAGIDLAYSLAEEFKIKDGNNRIIMATDGDFNVGPSSTKDMKDKVIEYRKKDIYISVLGYGMGNYKDDKMEAIAQNGNGNHAYIDNLQEAKKVLVNEMGGNLFTVAKDVKIQIEFNPQVVAAYRLVGYENRLLKNADFNNDKVDAGEVGLGHQVTALYEIVPANDSGDFTPLVDPLKYQGEIVKEEVFSKELATLKIRYKHPQKEKSEKMELIIKNKTKANVNPDFGFTSSVALFGMLLSQSEYVEEGSYKQVIALARDGMGEDKDGYRAEFIRLVGIAKSLNQLSQIAD